MPQVLAIKVNKHWFSARNIAHWSKKYFKVIPSTEYEGINVCSVSLI